MKYFLMSAVVSAMILLNACGRAIPSDVLPPEKMQQVLWDLLRADEWAMDLRASGSDTVLNLDATAEKLYQKVFAMHGTDRKTFEKSFSFYKGRPDLSKTLFDSLISAGNRQKEVLRKADSVRTAKEHLAAIDTTKNKMDTTARKDTMTLKKDTVILKRLKDSLLLKKRPAFKAMPRRK